MLLIKTLTLSLAAMFLVACSAHDEQFYRTNPQELQKALEKCPEQSSSEVSCPQLKAIALEVNQFVYELQISPQHFGGKIISLQTELAKQQSLLSSGNQSELQSTIQRIKNELKIRLAIVKWLESPES